MTKKIAYKGKDLFYELSGSGSVVVLLHGFAEDATVWKEQIQFLEKDFTVLAPHFPGSGPSPLADDVSMEHLAESVYFLLQSENIFSCSMIGHSMGGYVTLAFVEKYPSLLNGFGLFHSTAYADSEEKKETRRKSISFIREHGPDEFLKTTIPNLYSVNVNEQNKALIQQHLKQTSYFTAASLIAYYEAMILRPDRTDVLKQNKLPILFVLGRGDNIVPLHQGLQQSHLPETAYVHVLEQSGHMGMQEEPGKSNRILKNFLLKTV